MKWKRRNIKTSKRQYDEAMFGGLGISDSPDFTRAVMAKLGYMQVPPQVARRRRVRRVVVRCSVLAVLLLAAWVGITVHSMSPNARRALSPNAGNVPAAITSDLRDHQQRVNNVMQILREFPATSDAPAGAWEEEPAMCTPGGPADDELDEDIIRSAVAPFRWV